MKIKNKNYLLFLKEGLINTINELEIKQALANVKGRYVSEGRALLILLYYTGARPNEALKVLGKHINKQGNYITIRIEASKRGNPRTVYLSYRKELVRELYKFACSTFPEAFLFYHYRNNYVRKKLNKKGVPIETLEITDKLRYHFKKWFTGVIDITPYYLRHNRFSKLAEKGVNIQEMRILKGAKTEGSVNFYIHLSKRGAKKLSTKID